MPKDIQIALESVVIESNITMNSQLWVSEDKISSLIKLLRYIKYFHNKQET